MDGVDWCGMDRNSMDGCRVGNDGCRVSNDGSRVGDNGGWVGDRSRVSYTLVFDISNITSVSGSIGMVVHNLDAAIGQGHPVVSGHGGTIRSLVLAKVGTRVLILNAILKGIWLWWLSVAVSGGMDWDGTHWGMDNGSCVYHWCMDYWCCVDGGRVEDRCRVEWHGSGRCQGSDEDGRFGEHFLIFGGWLSVELLD